MALCCPPPSASKTWSRQVRSCDGCYVMGRSTRRLRTPIKLGLRVCSWGRCYAAAEHTHLSNASLFGVDLLGQRAVLVVAVAQGARLPVPPTSAAKKGKRKHDNNKQAYRQAGAGRQAGRRRYLLLTNKNEADAKAQNGRRGILGTLCEHGPAGCKFAPGGARFGN